MKGTKRADEVQETPALTGGLTEEQLEALRRKHGKLKLITVDGDRHFWFKKPDMNTVSASAAIAEADPIGASIVYFKNCLVVGDANAADDPDILLSMTPHLMGLIERKIVEVKNF